MRQTAVINILDKQTAELIAAGEVVERPASVVKELTENSIDAGASKITVDIESGGIKKITVQDNGCGIDSEYVRTAFVRHATSKISTKNDLDNIHSLGFRGEALPSIAGVSKLTLTTKTEYRDFAIEYKIRGGEEVSFEIKPFVNGTRFTVRDLFYNTPARMKFLKKDATEAGYVQDIVTNLALSKPSVSFSFIKDGKGIFNTIGDGNLLNTIASLFSTEFSDTLTAVDYSDDKYRISGYVTYPHSSRQSRNMQFSFVNGRFVKNKTIIAAVENAYKGTVMSGKFPGYVLNIDMPFELVDVNVHPAKTEVRFANDSEVFGAVYRAVKNAITGDVTLKQYTFKQQTAFDSDFNNVKQTDFTDKKSHFYINNSTENTNTSDGKYQTLSISLNISDKKDDYFEKFITPQIEENTADVFRSEPVEKYKTKKDADFRAPDNLSYNVCQEVKTDAAYHEEYREDIRVIGQIFDTYILCESNDELTVIDKHAAHERILYEKLMSNQKAAKQMLLTPQTVRLNRAEKAAIAENSQLLSDAGFEIEEFGETGVVVRAIPMYITNDDPGDLVAEIAYNLSNGNLSDFSEKIEWVFHSVACRSAIKGGDKSEINRLTRLVRDIKEKKIPLYCPHGRPIIISISRKDLEKQFGR
ncbi:MAG: DNA mismatch repair endonuclease MutL [Oscillospiraceae bacterium]|nr:DNA mismatch repair endonuclease MutL [Oscillospiraceae bacterium]